MSLAKRRLIVVGGKGGVGRTTMAAALSLALVRKGQRVLIAQTNANERLSLLLGAPRVGASITAMRENLWAVNMSPQAALLEYGTMVMRYETLSRAVLENRMVKHFLRAIPGLDEYSLLGKAWYHTTEELAAGDPRYHTVILDGPATGHLIAMLRIPQSILAAVPEGPLVRDARAAAALLSDPVRTTIVLVALAEELPVGETLDLYRQARELSISVGGLIVNQVWPTRFSSGSPARALARLGDGSLGDPVLDPLLEEARLTRDRRKMNDHYLERLVAELPRPHVFVPNLFAPDFGMREVERISALLEKELLQ